MITKSFLLDVDDFGRVALACREVANQDYLGIKISKDEVIHTIQCEHVQCTYLTGMQRCRCWCEWCSSILGLNLMNVSHCQTGSSMALLIPVQKTQPWASNCVLVMPWCDSCRVPRTLSLSDGGMMRASLWTSPSSRVSDSKCCQ